MGSDLVLYMTALPWESSNLINAAMESLSIETEITKVIELPTETINTCNKYFPYNSLVQYTKVSYCHIQLVY